MTRPSEHPELAREANAEPAPQGWDVAHRTTADSPPGPPEKSSVGVVVYLWHESFPVGELWLRQEAFPITSERWIQLLAGATADSIGERLFESGFDAQLPGPRFLVGSRQSTVGLDRLLAEDRPLTALSRPRDAFEKELRRSEPRNVSVVVCTRERPVDLERCLRSIDKLSPKPLEVVVVDNAPSNPSTREVVRTHPEVRYVAEPRAGLSVARNTGVRACRGDIIAFTDDDVEVDGGWISGFITEFKDERVGVVTGLILPASLSTQEELWFQGGEYSDGWGYRRRVFDHEYFVRLRAVGVPVWDIGAGANMAVRADLFTEVGGFDERLGAGASGCSEDSEFWYRAMAAGYTCLYRPDAVVNHHHRSDAAALKKQMFDYIRGHVTALVIQFVRHGHVGNLIRLFGLMPLHYSKLALLPLTHPDGPPTLWAVQVRGYFAGIIHSVRVVVQWLLGHDGNTRLRLGGNKTDSGDDDS